MAKRLSMFNKSLYSKVNPLNKKLLKDYTLELELNEKSPETIKAYHSDIKEFYCWLVKHKNPYILKCHKRMFRLFFLVMIKNKESHNRINRLQSSIRNLLEYAVDDDDLYKNYQINVMKKIPSLKKMRVKKIIFLKDKEITDMINYLLKHKEYELALYLSLSYDSAGRRGEIAQVTKTNFTKRRETYPVKGKEGKKFPLMYGDRTRKIAKLYFKQRGKDKNKSLWITINGNSTSYQELYYWCSHLKKVYTKIYHKPAKFTPHSFRHSALNNYANGTHIMLRENHLKKLPIQLLQAIGHHESASTTLAYLPDLKYKKLRKAFKL